MDMLGKAKEHLENGNDGYEADQQLAQAAAPQYVHIGSHVLNVDRLHHVKLHDTGDVYISHGDSPGFFLEAELCETFRNWWSARADVVQLPQAPDAPAE